MDNLTHSLAGAVLGQMGLKKKTGLGMATLIIAANIPDIDALAVLLGGHLHLAIRRGITHGPIAMLVLPLILTAIMIWFDDWQGRRGQKRWGRPADRLPIHKGWLLALAFIGTLSHPAMDWLNSYGVRLLEPFSSQWFYGDSIFIIDIWIWIALIAGVSMSRRREKKIGMNWQRPAWVSFAAVCAYIFANGLITGKAEADVARAVEGAYHVEADIVVANPVPLTFWNREILWRYKNDYFGDDYSIFESYEMTYPLDRIGTLEESNKIADLSGRSSDLAAFLFWSRMPFTIFNENATGAIVTYYDARFTDELVVDRFAITLRIESGDFVSVPLHGTETCSEPCASASDD